MPTVHFPCLTSSENTVRRAWRLICFFPSVSSVSKMLYQYFDKQIKLKRVFWSKIPPRIIRTISQISNIAMYKVRYCLSGERFYPLNSEALAVSLGEALCCHLQCEYVPTKNILVRLGQRQGSKTWGSDRGQRQGAATGGSDRGQRQGA